MTFGVTGRNGLSVSLLSVATLATSNGPVQTLNLDFTTGSLDGRITASGGTNGTTVNSSGVIVAATTPRFGYDPITHAALGVLVEESRTNLSPRSGADGTYTGWNAGFSVGVGYGASNQGDPFGTSNAVTITADGASSQHASALGPAITITNGAKYALSIFTKPGTASLDQLGPIGTAFLNTSYANFSLTSSGSVTQTAGLTSSLIQPLINGHYRSSIMTTATAGATNSPLFLWFISAGTDTRAPTNSSTSTLVITGLQTEVVSTSYPGPTSFIPTVATAVTRTADDATMTSTDFSAWFNANAGTFVTQFRTPPVLGTLTVWAVDDDSTNNQMRLRIVSGHLRFTVTVSGSDVADLDLGVVAAGTSYKAAVSYAANDFQGSLAGAAAVTDSSGALPVVDRMRFGTDKAANYLNDHIKSFGYYNGVIPVQAASA